MGIKFAINQSINQFFCGDSCEICTHTYWAYTGEFIHEEMFWPNTSNQPVTWDVEWNGDGPSRQLGREAKASPTLGFMRWLLTMTAAFFLTGSTRTGT
jgi:hypothetical protein